MNLQEIKSFLSLTSRLDGSFDSFLLSIATSRPWGIAISKELLISGREICKGIDESVFRCLIDSIQKSAGLGKGIFYATMMEMGETFARTQLKLWSVSGALVDIDEGSWQVVLADALSSGRISLAVDLIGHMEKQFSKMAVVKVFSGLSDEVLDATTTLWEPYKALLVSEMCSKAAFVTAIKYAGDDEALKNAVKNSIGLHVKFGSTPGDWPDLMQHMVSKTNDGHDKSAIINFYKSAGMVVVDQILNIPEAEIDNRLTNDEARMIAFNWGLEPAIKHVRSLEKRGEGLELVLGI